MTYKESNKYLLLISDCFPVKGFKFSTINDLTRKKVSVFPTSFFYLLEDFRNKKIKDVYHDYDDEHHNQIDDFILFLLQNEYSMIVENIEPFPKIKMYWDSSETINNIIIDFKNIKHNLIEIIPQLYDLNCKFLQLRFYESIYSLDEISDLITQMQETNLEGIELILKYDSKYSEEDYKSFFEKKLLLSYMYIHSYVRNVEVETFFGYNGKIKKVKNSVKREIVFSEDKITSEKFCGIISSKYFCVNGIVDFTHNSLYNSCLNKKISIDSNGKIKNCPSMKEDFGDMKDMKLNDVVKTESFKKYWNHSKDKIEVCKDCEFRQICTDCRAYIENSKNEFSKPLKCGYDPYKGVWEDWRMNPLKLESINYYGL